MDDADREHEAGDIADRREHLVANVAVQPPPFYRKSPEVWFRQLESQFVLARITTEVTKFHHTIAALPEDVACDLSLSDTLTYIRT
jgi:hypothetical protein